MPLGWPGASPKKKCRGLNLAAKHDHLPLDMATWLAGPARRMELPFVFRLRRFAHASYGVLYCLFALICSRTTSAPQVVRTRGCLELYTNNVQLRLRQYPQFRLAPESTARPVLYPHGQHPPPTTDRLWFLSTSSYHQVHFQVSCFVRAVSSFSSTCKHLQRPILSTCHLRRHKRASLQHPPDWPSYVLLACFSSLLFFSHFATYCESDIMRRNCYT